MTYEDLIALAEDCDNYVRPGPGRFEGCHDLRLAEALNEASLDTSWLDDETYFDDGAFVARIGRFLVEGDSQGFFNYSDYETDEAAREAFLDVVEDDRDTPDEEDAYITPHGQLGCQTAASFAGRFLGAYDDDDAAIAAIAQAMKDAQFWPNVWYVNDHGNTTLLRITDYDAGTWESTDTAYV